MNQQKDLTALQIQEYYNTLTFVCVTVVEIGSNNLEQTLVSFA